MGRGGELFFPPLRLCGQAARALRRASRFRHAGEIPQRDRRLRQARAERPFDQPHDLRLGRAGPRRSEARHVCLGRRADQLHHRDRLSRRRPAVEVLAGRRACDRQGHHPLPRHLLAGLPDVGRAPPLPRQIVVHGFLFNRGEKMSKSVGNVVSPADLVAAYGSIRCAISFCAKSRSDRTAIIRTRRSSPASTPISPTTSAIWRSARSSMIARNCASRRPGPAATPSPRPRISRCSPAPTLWSARRARHMQSFAHPPLCRRRCSTSSPRRTAISPMPSPGSSPRAIPRACGSSST